jgi:ABC-type transporter Mla MlaB component
VTSANRIQVLVGGRVVQRVDGSRVDVALIDRLARARLQACRRGADVTLRGAPDELYALAGFLGLADAIGLESRREPELGEQARIEEVVQPGDPAG